MVRRAVAGVLVVVVWLLAPFAVAGLWTRDRVLDTDGWVDLAERLPDDPRVREAVGNELTDVVLDELGVGERIRRRAEPVVREAADRALASATFATVWTTANREMHRSLVRVLEADGGSEIRLDLLPAIAVVLDSVEEPIAAVAPLPGDVPALGASPTREEAVAAIEAAIGHPLDPARTTVVVVRDERIAAARTIYRGADRGALLLVGLTVLLAALAIAVGRARWKVAAALALGSAATMLLGWVAAEGVGSVAGGFLGEGVGRSVAEAAAGVAAEDLGSRYVTIAIVLAIAGVVCGTVAAVLSRRG